MLSAHRNFNETNSCSAGAVAEQGPFVSQGERQTDTDRWWLSALFEDE